MDLNSALREEFDALKKSSAAHSIPHAQLQAAWARTMERALESLERKDEAIERYREKEEELERKIETLSEEVGRWKEAMVEEEEECTLAAKKYRKIQDVMEYAIELYPNFRSQFARAKERLRESQKTSYRGEGTFAVVERHFRREKAGFVAQVTPNGRTGEGWVHRRDSQGYGQ